MKTIKLNNRSGLNIYLEEVDKNVYAIKGNESYYRVGYQDKECTKIDFIDPDGGPFIKVGCFELNDGTVLNEIVEDESNRILFKFKLK